MNERWCLSRAEAQRIMRKAAKLFETLPLGMKGWAAACAYVDDYRHSRRLWFVAIWGYDPVAPPDGTR